MGLLKFILLYGQVKNQHQLMLIGKNTRACSDKIKKKLNKSEHKLELWHLCGRKIIFFGCTKKKHHKNYHSTCTVRMQQKYIIIIHPHFTKSANVLRKDYNYTETKTHTNQRPEVWHIIFIIWPKNKKNSDSEWYHWSWNSQIRLEMVGLLQGIRL